MNNAVIIGAVLLLVGCGEKAPTSVASDDAGSALDKQAVAVGIMPNPDKVELAGRFETRSDLGTDKFCAVGSGSDFDIGFLSMSGPDSKCEGRGTAKVEDGKVSIALSGKGDCSFDATYDGIELRFPGSLESGCSAYCSPRTSFSGTHYFLIQPGDGPARNTLGRDIERLCR